MINELNEDNKQTTKQLMAIREWLTNNHPDILKEYDDMRLYKNIFGDK